MSWLDRAQPVDEPATPTSDWKARAVPEAKEQEAVNQPAAPAWLQKAEVVSDKPAKVDGVDTEYTRVRKIIERPALDANIIGSEITTDAELEAIARHHGVDPEAIKRQSEFFGARRTQLDLPTSGRITGAAGRALGGIPQFAVKKLDDDPNYRKALDDVRNLADRKRSWAEYVAENVLPLGRVGKAIQQGTSAAANAVRGAVYGLASSDEGKELESTAVGAGAGVALGAGANYVGKKLGQQKPGAQVAGKAATAEGIDTTVRTLQADVGAAVDKKLASRAQSEQDITQRVLGQKTDPLATEQVERILKEQYTPDRLAVFTNPSTEEGRILRRSLEDSDGKISNEVVRRKLAEDLVDGRTREFARELVGSDTTPNIVDAREIISKQLQRNPQVANKYQDFVGLKTAQDAIEEQGMRATSQPGFAGRAAEFFSPNEYVARHIDDKYGRNIEGVLRDGSQSFNQSTVLLSKFRGANDELSDMADKLRIGDTLRTDPSKWYEAQSSGNLSRLTPQEQQFARKFAETAEKYRQEMNATGRLNIPQAANYVPKTVMGAQDLVPQVEKRVAQAVQDASQLTGRQIQDIGQLNNLELTQLLNTSPAMREVASYNKFLTGVDRPTPGELSSSVKESLYSSNGRRNLELRANSAMERTEGGNIPDFMLEKNPFKLLDKWSMNTTRGAFLGDTVNKLRNEVKILRKLGADVDAATVEKMAYDILGPRQGTAASATLNAKTGYQRYMDKLIDTAGGSKTVSGAFLNKLRVMPEVMGQALGQIYPNVLGANPASLVTNLGGNYVKMVPELGSSPYALKLATEATAKNIRNFKSNLKIAQQIGSVPAEFVRNQNRAIAEGVQRSGVYKAGSKAAEAANKVSMYLFQKTEEFNRGTAVELSRQLTQDLMQGNKGAVQVVNNMPRSLRLFVQSNIEQRPDAVGLELAKYFNNVIAQNYNKLSASEFARTAGPLFSAFTKWPSVALGQASYEIRRRGIPGGLKRNMELIGTPWLILSGIDYASGERADPDEDLRSDRLKKVIGSEGVSKLAPVGALKSFGTGDFFTPPAVGIVKKTAEAVTREDAEPGDVATKFGGEVVRNFVPGAGLLRFVSDDLSTYKTGTRPEGDNYFEKTAEGLNRLTK